jgi:hypothetical protein
VVFEPEEHDFLKVCLSCLEKSLQFVELGELDNLEDFARVLDQVKHGQVIQVEVVHNFAESLILDLSIEVDDKFFIFSGFL